MIRFPGSNCDLDTVEALKNIQGVTPSLVWHEDDQLKSYDCVILPGGFSYGDYLRAGAIAAHSPVVKGLKKLADKGVPILGICNGLQILAEAGLLPGVLLGNSCLKFVCTWVKIRVETSRTPFTTLTSRGRVLRMPIAHKEGRFFIAKKQLSMLYRNNQVVFKYVDNHGRTTLQANPNGALDNVAGVCNLEGNVVGMMPHPERASDPIISPSRSDDGRLIFESVVNFLRGRA